MNEHERRKLDVPQVVETERLVLRILGPGDGPTLYQAVVGLVRTIESLVPLVGARIQIGK